MGFVYDIRDGKEKAVEISGYQGRIEYLEIPEELEGLPVRVIQNRAFEGRQDLKEVTIPASVQILRPFAFYNCHHLKRIRLTDSVQDYYDGVIKLCEELRHIDIRFQTAGNYRLFKEMLGDNDGRLCFHLYFPDGKEAEFSFPDFSDDFEEDTYARTLHERIEGSGYEYRQTVKRGELDLLRYDQLFERGKYEALSVAGSIALSRLRYPYQLSAEGKTRYQSYIRERNAELLPWLLEEREKESLSFLANAELLTEEGIKAALPIAAEKQYTELTALLMNYQKQHFEKKREIESFEFS